MRPVLIRVVHSDFHLSIDALGHQQYPLNPEPLEVFELRIGSTGVVHEPGEIPLSTLPDLKRAVRGAALHHVEVTNAFGYKSDKFTYHGTSLEWL